MQQVEYVVLSEVTLEDLQDTLNTFGSNCWQVVHIEVWAKDMYMIVFARPVVKPATTCNI